jgi:hypothetical protein
VEGIFLERQGRKKEVSKTFSDHPKENMDLTKSNNQWE